MILIRKYTILIGKCRTFSKDEGKGGKARGPAGAKGGGKGGGKGVRPAGGIKDQALLDGFLGCHPGDGIVNRPDYRPDSLILRSKSGISIF